MLDVTNRLGFLGAAAVLLFGLNVPAQAQEPTDSKAQFEFEVPAIEISSEKTTPHEIIKEVTDEVLSIVKTVQTHQIDPLQASGALDGLLNQIVDFRFIVLNVMENSARTASKEQLQSFAKVFKEGLINTYAKGMTNFVDFEVKVLPPEHPITGRRSVTVSQEVKGPTGTALVSYSMSLNNKGEWVMRNVVINGINLGKQFRNQFRVAIKKNDNDLDKVIANWNA